MVKFEGYEFVDGGVCAAEGFTAAGVIAGIKAGNKVVTQGAYQVKLAGATNAIPAHSHEH